MYLPFWLQEVGWTAAKHLYPGARLRGDDGWLQVVTVVAVPGQRLVYNLAVGNARSYLVGAIAPRGPPRAVWVHNDCGLRDRLEALVRGRAIKLGVALSEQEIVDATFELGKRYLTGGGRGIFMMRGFIGSENIRKVVNGVVKGDDRVFYTTERLKLVGDKLDAAQLYELKSPFAITAIFQNTVVVRVVPALKYVNAFGRDFVKFDALDPLNPFVLIDRKLNIGSFVDKQGKIVLKSAQRAAFRRQAKALEATGNEMYRIRYEVPSAFVAARLRAALAGIMDVSRFDIVELP